MLPKLFSILILISMLLTGCGEKKEQDHNMKEDHQMTQIKSDSSIVREGVIDLASIDQNNDGYLYECTMDYNVISDKEGSCPVCHMDLEHQTIQTVKDNLQKNDYQVK